MIANLHGQVTEQSVNQIIESTKDLDQFELHIDSPGGDLMAGMKLFNYLQTKDVEIFVDGLAGSVASLIMLAGKDLPHIAPTGSVIIHNVHTEDVAGNHHDLRKVANSLEKYSEIIATVYANKTKLKGDNLKTVMDNEIPFNADDALVAGFAKDIYEPIRLAAHIKTIDMTILETVLKKLKNEVPIEAAPTEALTEESTEMENAFDEAQIAEITAIVQAVVAEALKGAPTEEEIGNTIATVLNSVVSKGAVPMSAQIKESPAAPSAMDAFNKKMNEIKAAN